MKIPPIPMGLFFLASLIPTLFWDSFASAFQGPAKNQAPEIPHAYDPRLVVELFAAAPDIVHPIGLDFDHKGRLLVIESHTHFPPKEYKGLKHDRVRMLEDTDGDGKADRFSTFFEGTRHTMDIAVHPDGSVYLATRNEILRLRDTKGEGKADEKQRLVFLETKGDYPHNGLSGLCFDSRGNLYFGMGENLGVTYKLIGSDGKTISGEGDGGHIFWCTADGKQLRRVATGFWNPFGICRDIYGRMFAVDNDPDAMPPCRMLHVVEGGDYGYQFRYGRSGRHPFQSWNGELPGTLPMVTGTGEAPCEILSYESDGLPEEYLGNLLVTSWADHRVERYLLKEKGASYTAERIPFIQGGKDFRPVGMAVAPDGSIYISDWVLRDYTLHGKGAIWHIRAKDARKPDRPKDGKKALESLHRPLREWAARELAQDDKGRAHFLQQLENKNPRIRAAAWTALLDREFPKGWVWLNIVGRSGQGALQMAVRALVGAGGDAPPLNAPGLKQEAIGFLNTLADLPVLLELLKDADPFIRHAAVHQLARQPEFLLAIDQNKLIDPRLRIGILLAHRVLEKPKASRSVPLFLADLDEDVRFLAAKWIADEKLTQHRELVVKALQDPKLNVRMYLAYATALARIDGKEVNENKLADYFLDRLTDPQSPPALRAMALQLVPAKHPKLSLDLLAKLLDEKDPGLQLEAARILGEHPNPKRNTFLINLARNGKLSESVRAQAILGLAGMAQDFIPDLLHMALKDKGAIRDEALRTLVQTQLSGAEKKQLQEWSPPSGEGGYGVKDLVARILGQPFHKDRPPAKDLEAWLKRLAGPGDVAAGRRIFAHSRLANCIGCHRCEGRGNVVGPDLSTIGRIERRQILEAILQPSNHVAPSYQAWLIETADGKIRTGMLTHTYLDEYTYLDEKGGQFKLNTRAIVSSRPAASSIMPDGLVDHLTDQEIRDLLAYLDSRR